MLHTRFIVEYLWIILHIKEAFMLTTTESIMYSSLILTCPCESDQFMYWHRNNVQIVQRKGKYILSNSSLEILDLREEDVGLYTCSASELDSTACDTFLVNVKGPSNHTSLIHLNTVPLKASDEVRDRIYWHPKMKREPSVYFLDFEPIVLSAYFYLYTQYMQPDVRWLTPSHYVPFFSENLTSQPVAINCNDLEESQRPMNGTCYRSSFKITSLSGAGEFVFRVQSKSAPGYVNHTNKNANSGNHVSPQLEFHYLVLKNMLHKYLEDQSLDSTHSRNVQDESGTELFFEDIGIKDYEVIDELRDELDATASDVSPTRETLVNSTSLHSLNQLSVSGSPPSSTLEQQTEPQLHCSTLHRSNSERFELFTHNAQACAGTNLTVDCRLPGVATELELWFLQPIESSSLGRPCSPACSSLGCFEEPQLLQISKVHTYNIVRQHTRQVDRRFQFDDNVAATMVSLQKRHSGLYLCKADKIFRTISVEVQDCSALQLDFKPLVLLVIVLLGCVTVMTLPLFICFRARRKPMFAIVSNPVLTLDGLPGSGTKTMTVVSHMNRLYPWLAGDSASCRVPESGLWASQVKQPLCPVQVNDSTNILRPGKRFHLFGHSDRIIGAGRSYAGFPYQIAADPKWEVPRSLIEIDGVLGQGNFGVVYQGVVRGRLPGLQFRPVQSPLTEKPVGTESIHQVAIKTLRDDHTQEEWVDLIRELETMKLLDPHPHVIQLLGACTQQGPPMILLEYAAHGNLRDYLRKNRPILTDQFGAFGVNGRSSACDVPATDKMSTDDELSRLDVPTLLRFASHVADALTYFESLKLAHRDIAARNVLVTDGYVAKLCDFGFTRVIEDYYRDTDRDQLPYRWMAPECFDSMQYSLKSDVWSFGIFLWELFSLGDTPYPGVSTSDLPDWLAAGNRNVRPALANSEVYDLMLRCWAAEPELRPTFQSIMQTLRDDCPPPPLHHSLDLSIEPSGQRQSSSSSRDSGFSSGNRSRQTSQPDSSSYGNGLSLNPHSVTMIINHCQTAVDDAIMNTVVTDPPSAIGGTVSRPSHTIRPLPPVRTCSLPGYGKASKGYVEMHCNEYLEPRTTLLPIGGVADYPRQPSPV